MSRAVGMVLVVLFFGLSCGGGDTEVEEPVPSDSVEVVGPEIPDTVEVVEPEIPDTTLVEHECKPETVTVYIEVERDTTHYCPDGPPYFGINWR